MVMMSITVVLRHREVLHGSVDGMTVWYGVMWCIVICGMVLYGMTWNPGIYLYFVYKVDVTPHATSHLMLHIMIMCFHLGTLSRYGYVVLAS